jgi:hypothetical protein
MQIDYPQDMRNETQDNKEFGYWLEACAEGKAKTETTETTEQPNNRKRKIKRNDTK